MNKKKDVKSRRAMMEEGKARRDEGMANAEAGAGEDWITYSLHAVCQVAQSMAEFVTDDVYDVMQRDCPGDMRAMGPVMIRAANAGYIEKTDRVKNTRRPSSHYRPVTVWRSLLFKV